jgi:hypothetical protein
MKCEPRVYPPTDSLCFLSFPGLRYMSKSPRKSQNFAVKMPRHQQDQVMHQLVREFSGSARLSSPDDLYSLGSG